MNPVDSLYGVTSAMIPVADIQADFLFKESKLPDLVNDVPRVEMVKSEMVSWWRSLTCRSNFLAVVLESQTLKIILMQFLCLN